MVWRKPLKWRADFRRFKAKTGTPTLCGGLPKAALGFKMSRHGFVATSTVVQALQLRV